MYPVDSSSPSGSAQPPRSNPGSSSGLFPPFACITPSTVIWVLVISFMIVFPLLRTPLAGVSSPLLRIALPRSDTTCENARFGRSRRADPCRGDGARPGGIRRLNLTRGRQVTRPPSGRGSDHAGLVLRHQHPDHAAVVRGRVRGRLLP